jgi:mono/diheme cytochrome c family protein
MRFSKLCLLPVAVLLAMHHAAAQEPVSVWDGVYAAEQASRGKAVYEFHCTECHGTLPALKRFEGQRLSEMHSFISRLMPDRAAGTLSSEDYAVIVAYLLRQSGMPPGDGPLPRMSRDMAGMLFTVAPPAR